MDTTETDEPVSSHLRCVYTVEQGRCRRNAYRFVDDQPGCSWHWQRLLTAALEARPVVRVARLDWARDTRTTDGGTRGEHGT